MLNKKSICLKVLCGFALGLISCFYIVVLDIVGSSPGELLVMGLTMGFIMGVASTPFKFTKVVVLIFAGFLAAVFLLLLNSLPGIPKSGLVDHISLPTYSFFLSVGLGIADRCFLKFIAGTIGGFIASAISVVLMISATLLTTTFLGAHPYPWLGDWPMYIASIITGILLIVGIGIKECFTENRKQGDVL